MVHFEIPHKYLSHTLENVISYNVEKLQVLRFMISCVFLKRPPIVASFTT